MHHHLCLCSFDMPVSGDVITIWELKSWIKLLEERFCRGDCNTARVPFLRTTFMLHVFQATTVCFWDVSGPVFFLLQSRLWPVLLSPLHYCGLVGALASPAKPWRPSFSAWIPSTQNLVNSFLADTNTFVQIQPSSLFHWVVCYWTARSNISTGWWAPSASSWLLPLTIPVAFW